LYDVDQCAFFETGVCFDMKLPMKVAGLCWSVTFLVTAVPGFYNQTRPMDFNTMTTESFSGMAIVETLAVSLIGSFAAAIIGFMIGDIFSNPQGANKEAKKAPVTPLPLMVEDTPEQSPAPEALLNNVPDYPFPEEPSDFEAQSSPPEPKP
jgi:hypothetical protein